MPKRYVSIWFRHLHTDRQIRRQPELREIPFVIAAPDRGRMVIKATNLLAEENGISCGTVVADARAIFPTLHVIQEELSPDPLLTALAEWCLRYTPVAAIDLPDGIMLDASGCTHLWGGERAYLKDIFTKLHHIGYDTRLGMADTIGAAWAVSRFDTITPIIEPGFHREALLNLPPVALRLEDSIVQRLHKLGLYKIGSFIGMPPSSLRRRFGQSLLDKLDQALGQQIEVLLPVQPVAPYQERLPCLEPVRTAKAIEIALHQLLAAICLRMEKEEKGLRKCRLTGYRIDGNIQQIEIGTSRASRNVKHLFHLFELKISSIEPDLGIELFVIEATLVEDLNASQEALWQTTNGSNDKEVAELLDKIAGKVGSHVIHRYLPDEHHWPERSFKAALSLQEKPVIEWRTDLPRPIQLLSKPEEIIVMVPVPDYPPVQFSYKSKMHRVIKADGPERIEQEWWIAGGMHRDYYCVEDENGARYWLFRLGHYNDEGVKWYLHGFFA